MGSIITFIANGFKKHFTPANLVLALIMFMVIFVLRTHFLPHLLTLRIDQFPNMSFELSIPKDICAGIISLFIRLGLKGIIEDIFAELFPTQKMPISHVLMAEQDKGKGVSRPSGSGISGPSGSGVSGPSGSSGEPSGLAGPSNSSEGDKDGRVGITFDDYSLGSDSDRDGDGDERSKYKNKKPIYDSEGNFIAYLTDSDSERGSDSGAPGPSNPKKRAIGYTDDSDSVSGKRLFTADLDKERKLIEELWKLNQYYKLSSAEDIQKASKEVLEFSLKKTKDEITDLENLHPSKKDMKEKMITRRDLMVEELEKIKRGEREEIIKDKGKGKEPIRDPSASKRVLTDDSEIKDFSTCDLEAIPKASKERLDIGLLQLKIVEANSVKHSELNTSTKERYENIVKRLKLVEEELKKKKSSHKRG